MSKHIMIVGSGIAGLAAGIYAQSSGFQVTILEQSQAAGGNCTGWKRKGYYFEGALHWLLGTTKTDSIYPLWQEVHVLNEKIKRYVPKIITTYYHGKEKVHLYSNPQRMREYFHKLSQEDSAAIEELYKDIVAFKKLIIPYYDLKGIEIRGKAKGMHPYELMKMAGCITRMPKLTKMSINEYTRKFKHTGIRAVLRTVIPSASYSSLGLLSTLGAYARGDACYLEGGSNGMIERMAEYFQELGGIIQKNVKVKHITVENNLVTSVMAEDKKFSCDAAIVASDTMVALNRLLDFKIEDKWVKEMNSFFKPSICSFVCLGLRKKLNGSKSITFIPDKEFKHFGVTAKVMSAWQYSDYPYAPKGCTALTVMIAGDTYNQWKESRKNHTYVMEKEKLGELVRDAMLSAFPEWDGLLEVLDVATPLTYQRYCGTLRGAIMGDIPDKTSVLGYPGTVNAVPNLFFAGQRLMGCGGMPSALITGRNAAQHVCKLFHHVFQ